MQAANNIGPISAGACEALCEIEHAIAVVVDEHDPVGQAPLIAFAYAVAIEIFELHASDLRGLREQRDVGVGGIRHELDVARIIRCNAIEGVAVADLAAIDRVDERRILEPVAELAAVDRHEDGEARYRRAAFVVGAGPRHGELARVQRFGQRIDGAFGSHGVQRVEDLRRVDRLLGVEDDARLRVDDRAGRIGSLRPHGIGHEAFAAAARVVGRQEAGLRVQRLFTRGRIDGGDAPRYLAVARHRADHVHEEAEFLGEVDALVQHWRVVEREVLVTPAEVIEAEGARVEIRVEGFVDHDLLRGRLGVRRIFEVDEIGLGCGRRHEMLGAKTCRPDHVVRIARYDDRRLVVVRLLFGGAVCRYFGKEERARRRPHGAGFRRRSCDGVDQRRERLGRCPCAADEVARKKTGIGSAGTGTHVLRPHEGRLVVDLADFHVGDVAGRDLLEAAPSASVPALADEVEGTATVAPHPCRHHVTTGVAGEGQAAVASRRAGQQRRRRPRAAVEGGVIQIRRVASGVEFVGRRACAERA